MDASIWLRVKKKDTKAAIGQSSAQEQTSPLVGSPGERRTPSGYATAGEDDSPQSNPGNNNIQPARDDNARLALVSRTIAKHFGTPKIRASPQLQSPLRQVAFMEGTRDNEPPSLERSFDVSARGNFMTGPSQAFSSHLKKPNSYAVQQTHAFFTLNHEIKRRIFDFVFPYSEAGIPITLSPKFGTVDVYPDDHFLVPWEVLWAVEGGLYSCKQLQDELMTYFWTNYEFHVVLSSYTKPNTSMLTMNWLPMYLDRIQFLTIEADFTKLSFGADPNASLLQTGGVSWVKTLIKKIVDTILTRRVNYPGPFPGPLMAKLHLKVRRYTGNRPGTQIPYCPELAFFAFDSVMECLQDMVVQCRMSGFSRTYSNLFLKGLFGYRIRGTRSLTPAWPTMPKKGSPASSVSGRSWVVLTPQTGSSGPDSPTEPAVPVDVSLPQFEIGRPNTIPRPPRSSIPGIQWGPDPLPPRQQQPIGVWGHSSNVSSLIRKNSNSSSRSGSTALSDFSFESAVIVERPGSGASVDSSRNRSSRVRVGSGASQFTQNPDSARADSPTLPSPNVSSYRSSLDTTRHAVTTSSAKKISQQTELKPARPPKIGVWTTFNSGHIVDYGHQDSSARSVHPPKVGVSDTFKKGSAISDGDEESMNSTVCRGNDGSRNLINDARNPTNERYESAVVIPPIPSFHRNSSATGHARMPSVPSPLSNSFTPDNKTPEKNVSTATQRLPGSSAATKRKTSAHGLGITMPSYALESHPIDTQAECQSANQLDAKDPAMVASFKSISLNTDGAASTIATGRMSTSMANTGDKLTQPLSFRTHSFGTPSSSLEFSSPPNKRIVTTTLSSLPGSAGEGPKSPNELNRLNEMDPAFRKGLAAFNSPDPNAEIDDADGEGAGKKKRKGHRGGKKNKNKS